MNLDWYRAFVFDRVHETCVCVCRSLRYGVMFFDSLSVRFSYHHCLSIYAFIQSIDSKQQISKYWIAASVAPTPTTRIINSKQTHTHTIISNSTNLLNINVANSTKKSYFPFECVCVFLSPFSFSSFLGDCLCFYLKYRYRFAWQKGICLRLFNGIPRAYEYTTPKPNGKKVQQRKPFKNGSTRQQSQINFKMNWNEERGKE